MRDLSDILGKEFVSPLTGEPYGISCPFEGDLPEFYSVERSGVPFAEDEGGNLFTTNESDEICYWDHETGDTTVIAGSFDEFGRACTEPREVKFSKDQVESVWIDPHYANQVGIRVPKDGWIKKRGLKTLLCDILEKLQLRRKW